MWVLAGEATDTELELRERAAERLRPALQHARLAVQAPDPDLAQARELREAVPDDGADPGGGAHDELFDAERLEDVEVREQVVVVRDVVPVVHPREGAQVLVQEQGFAADWQQLGLIHTPRRCGSVL